MRRRPRVADQCRVSHVPEQGTKRIHLGVLDGPALPPEVRDRLVGTTHGLRDEHEAVQLVLTQHVEQIRADAQDLKTYLLALMFEHHARRATVRALAIPVHDMMEASGLRLRIAHATSNVRV